MKLSKIVGVAAGVLLSWSAMAQQPNNASNSASARPIPESDILFKQTVWRKVDLREKQNLPMFAQNQEVTKFLVNAVKSGELTAYRSDSLDVPITKEQFIQRITAGGGGSGQPETQEERLERELREKERCEFYIAQGQTCPPPATASAFEYAPRQLYLLQLKEDVIFDKKRSRMYHDIQAVSLILPSAVNQEMNQRAFEEPLAHFKMSDLARVFRNNPQTAVWYNTQNEAQHKNLADAFDLWLFSSYITKLANASNENLGSGTQALLDAQQAVEALIEYEYSLWSY
ncbi:gliding motility protein GldN [Pontibacter harenae]|uniref:type IX secretion system ring protein PorN/GldN n=1 Tax=Pontibacter harenae TaxID=2894083 RepID=UPI001E30E69A|nr:gliding motility protein GldN [Pontibacter harenae]MCC9168454.1 gliding motility protein GldN [Pontibacter harenae]